MNEKFEQLMDRAVALIERIESVLPQPLTAPDWTASVAWRYRKRSSGHGTLEPVRHVASMALDDLQEIDGQKEKIQRNTLQFVQGRPANNVLLTGARGTGKSSLIKACLNEYSAQGLRLIEVDKADLVDLPDIIDVVAPSKPTEPAQLRVTGRFDGPAAPGGPRRSLDLAVYSEGPFTYYGFPLGDLNAPAALLEVPGTGGSAAHNL